MYYYYNEYTKVFKIFEDVNFEQSFIYYTEIFPRNKKSRMSDVAKKLVHSINKDTEKKLFSLLFEYNL